MILLPKVTLVEYLVLAILDAAMLCILYFPVRAPVLRSGRELDSSVRGDDENCTHPSKYPEPLNAETDYISIFFATSYPPQRERCTLAPRSALSLKDARETTAYDFRKGQSYCLMLELLGKRADSTWLW